MPELHTETPIRGAGGGSYLLGTGTHAVVCRWLAGRSFFPPPLEYAIAHTFCEPVHTSLNTLTHKLPPMDMDGWADLYELPYVWYSMV